MLRFRSAPRQTPARCGGATALLATALVAVAATAGRAQSNNKVQQPSGVMQIVAKGERLMTYYGGLIPKDGYLIVPPRATTGIFWNAIARGSGSTKRS